MADDASDPYAEFPRVKPAAPVQPSAQSGASDPYAEFPRVKSQPGTEAMAKAYNPQYKPPFQAAPTWPEQLPGVFEDIGKSAGSGVLSGTKGLAQAPTAIPSLVGRGIIAGVRGAAGKLGIDIGPGATPEREAAYQAARGIPPGNFGNVLDTISGGIGKAFDVATGGGAEYQPTTIPGRYTKSVTELAPAALLTREIYGAPSTGEAVAGGLRSAGKYAVAPGLAGQAASDISDRMLDPRVSPYVKLATELAVAGGTALTSRTVGDQVRDAFKDIAPGERDAIMTQAQTIMDNARAQGQNPTWAETVDQASNGRTGFAKVLRLANAVGKAPVREAMAERPGLVQAGGQRALADITAPQPMGTAGIGPPQPPTPDTSLIGPRLGEAATEEQGAMRAGINVATDPLYAAADRGRLSGAAMQQLIADPLYMHVLTQIRGNPALNYGIETMPNDSVAVQDVVQRRLGEMAEAARTPGEASLGNTGAGNLDNLRRIVRDQIGSATGTTPIGAARTLAPGQTPPPGTTIGTYDQAKNWAEQFHQQVMDSINNGPIGALAQRDITTAQAVKVLTDPSFSPEEIGDAVRRLSARNPWAAQQLVRNYAQGVFGEATDALQKAAMRGDQGGSAALFSQKMQTAEVGDRFRAALAALPDGATRAEGFQQFLDALAPYGRNPPIGSRTAFNAPDLQKLGQGIVPINPARWSDRINAWRQGQNLNELATLITDPEGGIRLRQLLNEPDKGGPRFQALMTRLLGIAAGSQPARDVASQRAAAGLQ
jgi:hypothetical protein